MRQAQRRRTMPSQSLRVAGCGAMPLHLRGASALRLTHPTVSIIHIQNGGIAVSEYRRYYVDGAMVFFTLVTHQRRKPFEEELARKCLREAIETVRKKRPFSVNAVVLLPDHLHMIWTLPADDGDFSLRCQSTRLLNLILVLPSRAD